tara:strand:+ start:2131 stop:2991 length:861 start_codon:yes stop_codon:yes gene_type:complete
MITWSELTQPYLPSSELWRGITPPLALGPDGAYCIEHAGNAAFGFFDNFHSFQASTLEGPYRILEGTGCTIEQIADTANEKGLVQLALDGNAENDEAVLQWGRGLGAPFKLADRDLVFEARFSVSQITAGKYSLACGLGETSMGAADGLFVDSTQALADKNFIGFVSLNAEGASLDAAYKADGQTYQDGGTKSKLDALHTMVADAYFKVGFRYRAHPKKLEFYVNNVLPGGMITPSRLTRAEIDASTFPDDVFLAPIIGVKDAAGDTALNVKLDWWGCVQELEGPA